MCRMKDLCAHEGTFCWITSEDLIRLDRRIPRWISDDFPSQTPETQWSTAPCWVSAGRSDLTLNMNWRSVRDKINLSFIWIHIYVFKTIITAFYNSQKYWHFRTFVNYGLDFAFDFEFTNENKFKNLFHQLCLSGRDKMLSGGVFSPHWTHPSTFLRTPQTPHGFHRVWFCPIVMNAPLVPAVTRM